MYEDSFLEQGLPDADGLTSRPDQRREAADQPADHVAGDHGPSIDAQVMLAVDDHRRRLVHQNGAQHATGTYHAITRHLQIVTTLLASPR